jgi:hypothetical protein
VVYIYIVVPWHINWRKYEGYPQKKKNSALGEHRDYVRICPSIPKVKTFCAKTFRSFQTVNWKRLGLDMATIHEDSAGETLWIDEGLIPKKVVRPWYVRKDDAW